MVDSSFKRGFPIALALLPLAYIIWLCVSLHVDIPFGDQWELVPRLNHLDAGTFTFHDVWQQHNENRIVFPILLMLGLAWATDWSVSVEIAVNVVLGMAIFAVYAVALRSMCRDAIRRPVPSAVAGWWALPVISLLVFSPAQWENWLWGWQMQIFMAVLGSVFGFCLLSGPGRSPRRFAAAIAAGLVSTYSVGSGLPFWVVGLIALRLNPDQRTGRRLVIWLFASAIALGTYFIGYQQGPGHQSIRSNFTNLDGIVKLVEYALTYLGAPVAGFQGTAARLAGALGLATFVGLLISTRMARTTGGFIFPCLIGIQAIADASMTALGRSGYGIDQAMSSRYQTIGAPFWIAIMLLAVLALHRQAVPQRRRIWTAVSVCGALALSVAILDNGRQGLIGANQRMDFLRAARPSLVAGINWKMLSRLYIDDVPSIRERAGILKMLGMSVYREGQ